MQAIHTVMLRDAALRLPGTLRTAASCLGAQADAPSLAAGFSGRPWQQQRRGISEEQINADGSTVAELFEKNMAKASRKRNDEPPRILTTRREALHLYREILRYSNLFVWRDEKGRMWRDVLRGNARKVGG